MEDQQESNVLPITGTVSTGKKERKKRTPRAAAEVSVEQGGFTMRYPDGLEAEVREVSESKGLPIGTVRKAVEASIVAAWKKDTRDVATIVKDHLFG